MSSRELALVRDVGFLTLGFRRRNSVSSGWDLRITESEFTISPAAETMVIGGHDAITIPYSEVKRVSLGQDRASGFHLLTISYFEGGRHWWNTKSTVRIVLREFQFAQVADALNGLPALNEKLRI